MAVENSKREMMGREHMLSMWRLDMRRWAVCTRVDGGENGGVGHVEVKVEQGDTLEKVRAHCTLAETQVQDSGRAEENAAAPVGVEDTLDRAHDDQTLR
jgi:hypothetical protein